MGMSDAAATRIVIAIVLVASGFLLVVGGSIAHVAFSGVSINSDATPAQTLMPYVLHADTGDTVVDFAGASIAPGFDLTVNCTAPVTDGRRVVADTVGDRVVLRCVKAEGTGE